MHNLTTLAQQMGPFILIPILFFVVGIGAACNIIWGLLTGGPRALTLPGAPYLYDRVYYCLQLVAFLGWTGALLAFVPLTADRDDGSGFMIGWGVGAIGIAALFLTRATMMIKAMKYRAEHGFWLSRFFNRMQAVQFERQPAWMRQFIAVIFLIAGTGILIFNLPHLPAGLTQMRAGATTIVHLVTNP